MRLSKTTLAKISAHNSTWLGGRGSKRFAESEDGGVIYIQHHPALADTVITIFAMKEGKGEVPNEKIGELSHYHPLYIVLPYSIISPLTLSTLMKIESRWEQHSKPAASDKKYGLRDIFQIDVVVDVGKDSLTGEVRYVCRGYDIVTIADVIKRELVAQGAQTDLDPFSVSGFKMRAAIRKFWSSSGKGVTLRKVNESIRKAKKRLFPDEPHFEELNREQKRLVFDSIATLFKAGLQHDVVKAETMRLHGIADCAILDEVIVDIQCTKEGAEWTRLKEEKTNA